MSTQFMYVFGLLATGFCMGIVFDIYNTVTGASKWFKWLRPTCDFVFWVASALATYYVVFITDDGRIRIYIFGVMLLGYVGYRWTIRRMVIRSAFIIVRFIEGLIRGVARILYTVTIRPLRLLFRIVAALLRVVYRVLCVLETWVFHIIRFWLNVLLIRWVLRWPAMRRVTTKVHGYWEEMWTRASNWLKSKWVRG